ncbi:MAG: hypothetical protein Q4G34_06305 [Micrococcus sp.]|nr:hypothetical protein [Micrococcus sp.]
MSVSHSIHPEAARGLRRLQLVTWITGMVSAVAVGGVLALQRDPLYVRAMLEGHQFGLEDVSAADVAQAQTSTLGVVAAVLGILALTAGLHVLIGRRVRAARWIGLVSAVLGGLIAAFWTIDSGRMVGYGGVGPAVLAAVLAMMAACLAWCVVASLREQREAFLG